MLAATGGSVVYIHPDDKPLDVRGPTSTKYDTHAFEHQTKDMVWSRPGADKPCLSIAATSRCLCGHAYDAHPEPFQCVVDGCKCDRFFFIITDGPWELKCRCKHKAADHCSERGDHPCTRYGCNCKEYVSPWRCTTCGDKWDTHELRVVDRVTPVVATTVVAATTGAAKRAGGTPELYSVRKLPPAPGGTGHVAALVV